MAGGAGAAGPAEAAGAAGATGGAGARGGLAPAVPWAALAGAAAVLAAVQLATPDLVGNDAWFHVRYAQVVREAGLRGYPPPFPWLPLTIRAPDRYADHHTLFHVLLAPFTVGDLRIGGKAAAVACALAFVATFVWVLRGARVPAPGLAVLALGASAGDLLFRLSMTRVQALSLVCLLAGFHFALARRHLALAALAGVYVWLYDGFVLLAVPLGAALAADLATERRLRLAPAGAALAGALGGLVAHPYFPHYLTFMIDHLGDKLLPGEPVAVGGEWDPYDPLGLLNALPALVYVAAGARVLGRRGLAADRRALAAFLMAAAFLVLMLRAQRFVEYFAPVATLFAALAAGGAVARLRGGRRALLAAALAAVTTANALGVAWTLRRLHLEAPGDRYAAAARHVAREAPPGAMLCTTDWDEFPLLYFHNVESTYLVGLDPTYFRNRFPDAYWQWVDASAGRGSTPSRFFGARLPCAYVLSDRDHAAFLAQADADPGFERVLAGEHAVLYRVRRDGPPPLYPTTIE
jgi:hypothetical protein